MGVMWTDVNGDVSQSLWIYFVVTVPLTAAIVGAWCAYDQRISKIAREKDIAADEDSAEKAEREETRLFEARIMRNIRRRTGIKVADGALPERPTRVGALAKIARAATAASKHG